MSEETIPFLSASPSSITPLRSPFIVFDYSYVDENGMVNAISIEDIYFCRFTAFTNPYEITHDLLLSVRNVYSLFDEDQEEVEDEDYLDLAIIQLDRAVLVCSPNYTFLPTLTELPPFLT